MANEKNTAKRTLTPEEKAHKATIQRAYIQRKIANETTEEREKRLAKSRAYTKACYDRNIEHSRELSRAKAKRAYASNPDKFREINASARAANGDKWNANRRERFASDPAYAAEQRALYRAWNAANPEARREYNAAYHAANRPEQIIKNRLWREANAEQHLANARRWYEENLERAKANYKAWRASRPNYVRDRYQTDAEFKLVCCLRARLVSAVKRQKGEKSAKSSDLFGCDVAFLRQHLEVQFAGGMTWENYGTFWHVDHIMPCVTFDLTDPDQQRACFHYTNLRPLTAAENLARPRHPRHYAKKAA